MPRKWTKAQREAQSRKISAYWAKVKADKEAAKRIKEARERFDTEPKLAWWQRVMQAVGFRHGA